MCPQVIHGTTLPRTAGQNVFPRSKYFGTNTPVSLFYITTV